MTECNNTNVQESHTGQMWTGFIEEMEVDVILMKRLWRAGSLSECLYLVIAAEAR